MKKEYIYAILIAVSVILISNLPVIIPYSFKNDSLKFLGRRVINSEDVYTYVSTIEQVRQGRILVENQYTSEPQKPSLLRLSYIFIGKTAKITGISSVFAYHLFRIIFSGVLCFIIYKFVMLFFETPGRRLTAYLIVLTASGLGFVFLKWLPESIDLWIPEAFTFLSFSEAPHFTLSLALLLTGFYFLVEYLRSNTELSLLPLFASFLLLSFEHPFDIVFAVPVIFITVLWVKRSWFKAILISFFGGIGISYQLIETYGNPVLKTWQAQNILPSPSPVNILVGFGLLILFALIGLEIFAGEKKPHQKLLISWILIVPLIIYLPVNFQRRFLEGMEIPISIAAATGLFWLMDWYKGRYPKKSKMNLKMALLVTITVFSITSIYTIVRDFTAFKSDSRNLPYYFIKEENLDAILWLQSRTTFSDIILSNRYFGNLIPGLAGRKVFLGHNIQTTDINLKINETNSFLLEQNDTKAANFLRENRITYIFLGANDSMIEYGFKPEDKSYLTKVYDSKGVSIYRVN